MSDDESEWLTRGSMAAEIDGGSEVGAAVGIPTTVKNYVFIDVDSDGEMKVDTCPLPIDYIARIINETTGGWPCRVGNRLFIDGPCGVSWISSVDELFAFIGTTAGKPADFKANHGLHTKKEVSAHLQMTAKSYLAVETLPHEPAIHGHYYSYKSKKRGNGEALRTLVNRFSPETDIDRDLLLAAIVTPFWGGHGGSRPAICLTSDHGRGSGKTKFVQFVARIAGGALDVSNQEDVATVKKRLLSPEGQSMRLVWIDNIKTTKLSWAELESLITAQAISGHRLYVGEGQRPNNLTYFLTMNGVSLSQDMAQRAIIIKLQKPEYSATWDDETKRFVDENREEIIADILEFLRTPITELNRYSRWGDWDRDILSRLPDPSEAQIVIAERRAAVDCDTEESSLIEDFFRGRLSRLSYDVLSDRVFIPSAMAAKWLALALNDRHITTTKASQAIRQKIDDGSLKQLSACRTRQHGRGFEFWGMESTGQTYLHTDIDHRIEIHGDR